MPNVERTLLACIRAYARARIVHGICDQLLEQKAYPFFVSDWTTCVSRWAANPEHSTLFAYSRLNQHGLYINVEYSDQHNGLIWSVGFYPNGTESPSIEKMTIPFFIDARSLQTNPGDSLKNLLQDKLENAKKLMDHFAKLQTANAVREFLREYNSTLMNLSQICEKNHTEELGDLFPHIRT